MLENMIVILADMGDWIGGVAVLVIVIISIVKSILEKVAENQSSAKRESSSTRSGLASGQRERDGRDAQKGGGGIPAAGDFAARRRKQLEELAMRRQTARQAGGSEGASLREARPAPQQIRQQRGMEKSSQKRGTVARRFTQVSQRESSQPAHRVFSDDAMVKQREAERVALRQRQLEEKRNRERKRQELLGASQRYGIAQQATNVGGLKHDESEHELRRAKKSKRGTRTSLEQGSVSRKKKSEWMKELKIMDRGSLRRAIVLKEILDVPVSLRSGDSPSAVI